MKRVSVFDAQKIRPSVLALAHREPLKPLGKEFYFPPLRYRNREAEPAGNNQQSHDGGEDNGGYLSRLAHERTARDVFAKWKKALAAHCVCAMFTEEFSLARPTFLRRIGAPVPVC